MRLPLQAGLAVATAFVLLTIWPAWGGGDAQGVEIVGSLAGYFLFAAGVVLMVLPQTRETGWAVAAYVAAFGGFAASFLVQFVEASGGSAPLDPGLLGYAQSMVFILGALLVAMAISATLPVRTAEAAAGATGESVATPLTDTA